MDSYQEGRKLELDSEGSQRLSIEQISLPGMLQHPGFHVPLWLEGLSGMKGVTWICLPLTWSNEKSLVYSIKCSINKSYFRTCVRILCCNKKQKPNQSNFSKYIYIYIYMSSYD